MVSVVYESLCGHDSLCGLSAEGKMLRTADPHARAQGRRSRFPDKYIICEF